MDFSFFSNINQKSKKSKKNKTTKKSKTKSSRLDQWYTTPKLAEDVIKKFYSLNESKNCDIIVEPSAGTGILLDLIKGKKIGFDLDPKRNDIIQSDFFKITKKDINLNNDTGSGSGENSNLCFLGNPPFSIAKDFFNHSASMNPYIIAMILPRRFKNPKFIRLLNKKYYLIYNYDIDCCYIYNGKEIELPTVFQVWLRHEDDRSNWKNQKIRETDFVFVHSKKRKEKIFSLRNPNRFVFVIKNTYNLPDKISTTDINDLWDIYRKRLKSKRTKKTVHKIIDTILNSYHFLEVDGTKNAQAISDLFNLVDPNILLKYQTCSKSMKRCSLSQENLLELYNRLKDTSAKSIYLNV